MGVWDRSATIIAETTVPLFKRDKHDYYNPGDDEASSNTQPYLEWKNINIDKRLVLDTGFEEVFAQVCLCDEALDCFTPENWHDLGSLTIEPVSTPGFFAPIGRGNVVGFGFDLFKTFEAATIEQYYPDMVRLKRFDLREIFAQGICAQQCQKDPLCIGYDWVKDDPEDGLTYSCRFRAEGLKLHKLTDSGAAYQFYMKTEPRREEWNWFPVLDQCRFDAEGYSRILDWTQ